MLPHLDEYILHLKNHGYSGETIYNYRRDLTQFSAYLGGINKSFDGVTQAELAGYKSYLVSEIYQTGTGKPGKKLSTASVNRVLASLRSYLRWRYTNGDQTALALFHSIIPVARGYQRNSSGSQISKADFIRLIESPCLLEKNKIVGLRNRAMLEVLFATGMRISELTSLNRSHIDGSGRIFITGKGKKQRFVYLTPRAMKQLDVYLKQRQDDFAALFIPYRGENSGKTNRRISTNYLQMKIKQYRELLRINVPTSAHSLRHGFATYLAESGANPAAIQVLLGHESLDTTTRYVHASDKYAETTHRKFHPLSE